jgi:hypothetical protein
MFQGNISPHPGDFAGLDSGTDSFLASTSFCLLHPLLLFWFHALELTLY